MNRSLNCADHVERIADRVLRRQRQFAADASHELRTPIAAVRVELEAALLYPGDAREALDGALGALERLESITADLLLLADIGTVPLTTRDEVDLGRVVTDELGCRPERRRIRINCEEGVAVEGSHPMLSRLVAGLLDNAERHAATTVDVDVRRDGDRALLSVANDGEPVPVEDRTHIFELFARRDAARSRSHGGAGLGLAIVREVVRAHGGDIIIQDGDPGVRFVVRLPLASSVLTSLRDQGAYGRSLDTGAPNPLLAASCGARNLDVQ
ncbi:sensor histidine kinase [Planotetraspora kaengkrachanensis]|uniref:histidine kinase n=1 Tax=Planotetraspora kaengkrachanensis TaxID=575193 RepID=A0A8J3PQT1_9ACTN|nr:HAMP domain-containing sensor histidine kinase [Planotetraspora kaengkrachanensis]GIG77734.1 hypothetical protein Pka01_08610 [Planotetraspora kaengkrachanensis]